MEQELECKHTEAKAPCSHRRARIKGSELMGFISCPDCKEEIHLQIVINAWLDAMEEKLSELSKLQSRRQR